MSKKDKRTAQDKDFYVRKGHDNNQCRTLLAKMTIRERRQLSLGGGAAFRKKEQLLRLGKLDRARSVKTEFNVP